MIWQTSTDNTTFKTEPTPIGYKIDWEDLDSDSYRSVINGNLIRSVIKRRWAKVSLSFFLKTVNDVDDLLKDVNKDTVYFKFKSPAFGTNEYITFKGYVSKMSVETTNINAGWSVSFNVIQSNGESWQ